MKTREFPKFRQEVLKKFALELKQSNKGLVDGYRQHVVSCQESLLSSDYHSFILPTNGEIVKYSTPVHIKFEDLHLPFDKCVFEYQISSEYYSKAVEHEEFDQPNATVLIVEKTEDSITLIPVWHIRSKETGTYAWVPCMFGVTLDRESYIEVKENAKVEIRAPKIALVNQEMMGIFHALSPEMQNNLILETTDELRVVAHFAMLCGCDNVKAKKLYAPSEESVRLAKLRGKPRPYDYWVLDVYMNEEHEGTGAGLGGSHSSPRFHVRRGHIRRYQTGKTTWVKQHTVGTPELGVIEKDYRVVA